jgi:K+-sensing histidine kinase KdpD
MPRYPSHFQRYAVAVGAVLVAFVLRYEIYGTLDYRLPFAFFLPAAIVAAWYGGLGPGLLAALAGLLLGDYFFLPPHKAGAPMGEAERAVIGLYAMNTALIVVLFWHLHAKLQESEDELKELKGGREEEQEASGGEGIASPGRQANPSGPAHPF